MRFITSPHAFSLSKEDCAGTCITIGNFDGVHKGHQSLLKRTFEKASLHNLLPTVVTFWPHPLAVLAGARAPALLTSQAERLRLFEAHGMELTLELAFTRDLATLTPEEFVKNVIVPLRCKHLIIGYDFSLGKNRSGNVETLIELGLQYGFEVEQMPPVMLLDAVVSSTRIRDLLRAGEVWEAQTLLGRYYNIQGEVVHGYGRGTDLGFPTANVHAPHTTIPRNGVYATLVLGVMPHPIPAVTNIGYAPTFGNQELSIESFFLDGKFNIYGQEICLSFVQSIREEQRFNNIDELKERIAKDVALAQNILTAVR